MAENLAGRLTDVSNRVQEFFREWDSIDDGDLDPRFIDLYAPLDFMVRLHAGMGDDLTDAEFEERFSANTRLLSRLAGQLMATVIESYAERSADDRVVRQIQSWQRDPLVADLIAAWRRERNRDPLSDGWMSMPPSRPGAGADPEHDKNGETGSGRLSYA